MALGAIAQFLQASAIQSLASGDRGRGNIRQVVDTESFVPTGAGTLAGAAFGTLDLGDATGIGVDVGPGTGEVTECAKS